MTAFLGSVSQLGGRNDESVNLDRVLTILKSRGYGFGAYSGYAFCLCKRSGKVRKTDGMPLLEPFGRGITKRDRDNILKTSSNNTIAADRIEAIAKGESADSFENDSVMRGAGGFTQEQVTAMVQNGVRETLRAMGIDPAAVQPKQEPKPAEQEPSAPKSTRSLDEYLSTIPYAPPENLVEEKPVASPAQKKRGGRPKGSKNKKTLEAEARLAKLAE